MSEIIANRIAELHGKIAKRDFEIERLRGLLANSEMTVKELLANDGRLKAALRKIADSNLASPVMYGTEMREIARAALERP